ncbi:hypothetical protein EVAR_19827_1 [Eumeta japonica]|uniref:Uncharacterized protein n=1 Tax=Eumeta variegata TaxID=151549 RepID=A0A4C1USJ8_EUMVA|nr:hypothetical protein EVAR_19827_1 [Eumeta japonica]
MAFESEKPGVAMFPVRRKPTTRAPSPTGTASLDGILLVSEKQELYSLSPLPHALTYRAAEARAPCLRRSAALPVGVLTLHRSRSSNLRMDPKLALSNHYPDQRERQLKTSGTPKGISLISGQGY